MTYLTIRSEGAQPARRVEFAQFAELFADMDVAAQPRPRRRRAGLGRLAAAPLLVAALAGNLVLLAKPAALAAEAARLATPS